MKFAFGGALLLATVQNAPAATLAQTVPLTITGAHAHRFKVEVAATPAAQERGLMFRKTMAPTHGMIFPMDPPRPAIFWMKNTYLPLDIIFIGPDHRIIRIADAKPMSEDLVPCREDGCHEPVAAVLELNAGTSAREGIKPGDKVEW